MTVEEQQQGLDLSAQIIKCRRIQNHGINASDITKTQGEWNLSVSVCHDMINVVCSLVNLLYLVSVSTTRRNLLKIKGFSEIKVEKIKISWKYHGKY